MKFSIFGVTILFGVEPCRKLNYRTERAALKAIHKQASLGRTRYRYFCPDCQAWHLTKQPQSA
jgi:hypothetical protein